ncbi:MULTISPECIES: 8-amino-7-oxononanoate synthase [unclassified Legionella]|uniref:aminotransferase class I/II-fold pyridoxal phosphate-dependent enzyme n=1 Tax=unclassified Legionella TaxID=2622702 RepID=UPI0010564253|nr:MULTISPECIES: 8-amino-7-oxononanoate synthase [unclassified Legionella]MDI9818803.1 8-amino-7-oxononanoate synthase [Legionella sp. PL877]
MINQLIVDYSHRLLQQGLYRQRSVVSWDAELLNFSSNDYLSLKQDKRVGKAYQTGFEKYPSGSSGSMVVCGYHPVHKKLEEAFSKALQVDDALLFSSGYAANLGVVSLLAGAGGHLLIDKALHASLYDGIKLADARYTRFMHNEADSLSSKLAKNILNPVVLTEGIFSMSGQMAPLAQISQVAKQFEAALVVDEAHAFGICGEQGLGAVVCDELTQEEVPLRIIPFGKSFASQGAVVAGQKVWIDALLQSARSYIYSTAISPAMSYGVLETLTIIRESDDRRRKLFQLIDYFRKAIENSPLKWQNSTTPIQQLKLGCPHKALDYTKKLRNQGIFCQAIREPTVSKKNTGLRIILNCHHEPEDIDKLLSALSVIYETEY